MEDQAFGFRLDLTSGVPVYRQLIDQVLVGKASGLLQAGVQLPTVRQLAVDLSINPNTVIRAYKELEIRGILTTQQGMGTFVTKREVRPDQAARQRRLTQMVEEFVARAGAEGYTVKEIMGRLTELVPEPGKKRN